jgi:cytoskeletal protein CcmA (bactofilin family)
MWTKYPQTPNQPATKTEAPHSPSVSAPVTQSAPSDSAAFYNGPARSNAPTARPLACIGATLDIKGRISGEEDLQIDGKVEGPVSLRGHRLIVGRSSQMSSEIMAREVIVYGNLVGNVRASDRVEIKKDGKLTGDITTARISIEDGAIFKGRIEIERQESKASVRAEAEAALVPA